MLCQLNGPGRIGMALQDSLYRPGNRAPGGPALFGIREEHGLALLIGEHLPGMIAVEKKLAQNAGSFRRSVYIIDWSIMNFFYLEIAEAGRFPVKKYLFGRLYHLVAGNLVIIKTEHRSAHTHMDVVIMGTAD